MTQPTTLTDYFWAITVQPAQTQSGATALASYHGSIGVAAGQTRQSIYEQIRDHVVTQLRENGLPAGHNVLWFDLHPNQL